MRALATERRLEVEQQHHRAIAEGFTERCVTGGEPFLEPDIVEILAYPSERMSTVCLTNGMLYQVPGWASSASSPPGRT